MVKKENSNDDPCVLNTFSMNDHRATEISTPSNGNNSPTAALFLSPSKNSTSVSENTNLKTAVQETGDDTTLISSKTIDAQQLSMLSQEELISQLLGAHDKIRKLEARQQIKEENIATEMNEYDVDTQHIMQGCISRPTFAYSNNGSVSMLQSFPGPTDFHLDELQSKLEKCAVGDFDKPFVKNVEDEVIVAYEYRGSFPNCDEDLIAESEENLDDPVPSIVLHGIWDDEVDESDERTVKEEFPLIPSPVLNTPPYEYIFLTKENEAKFRIFLNPKLNQVFQEELRKLRKYKADQIRRPSNTDQVGDTYSTNIGIEFHNHANHMDIHNRNHLVNCSSANEVLNSASISNVIHCFDPSDVDLELKKIFTEKPPITHKIVRRKSRHERGSSVPGIDSYYGTHDLNKVGHASYFIPTLTESERKAIGWKPEYHYGHWKYSALQIPNSRTNPIFLHPHPHLEGTHYIKQKQESNHIPNKAHNHHEMDTTDGFLLEADAESLLKSSASVVYAADEKSPTVAGDTLSFITLSGTDDSAQTCHIIPDKSTLRRILKWIMPCMSAEHKSSDVSVNDTECGSLGVPTQNLRQQFNTVDDLVNEKEILEDFDDTIIETLVEPPNRLNSPMSHTHISFDVGTKSGQIQNQSNQLSPDKQSYHSAQSQHQQQYNKEVRSHSHHHHRPNHHHGFFHWKHLLNHGTKSNKSMTVVGGDLIESNPTSTIEFPEAGEQQSQSEECGTTEKMQKPNHSNLLKSQEIMSSTDDDEMEKQDNSPTVSGCITTKNKKTRRMNLKACRAYEKLLTLKDLGYQSGPEHSAGEIKQGKQNVNFVLRTENTKESLYKPHFEEGSDKSKQICSDTYTMKAALKKSENIPSSKSKLSVMNKFAVVPVPNHAVSFSYNDDDSIEYYDELSPYGMDGNDDGYSYYNGNISSGAGYSMDPMSNQNFYEDSNFYEDMDFDYDLDLRSEQDHVETRFLDPKDLLTPRYQDLVNEQTGNLPFTYNMDYSYAGNSAQTLEVVGNVVEDEENVTHWVDHKFVQEIEQELGLINSCLDSLLDRHRELMSNAGHPLQNSTLSDNNESLEKVDGQHKIFTLNDIAQETQRDSANENMQNTTHDAEPSAGSSAQ